MNCTLSNHRWPLANFTREKACVYRNAFAMPRRLPKSGLVPSTARSPRWQLASRKSRQADFSHRAFGGGRSVPIAAVASYDRRCRGGRRSGLLTDASRQMSIFSAISIALLNPIKLAESPTPTSLGGVNSGGHQFARRRAGLAASASSGERRCSMSANRCSTRARSDVKPAR